MKFGIYLDMPVARSSGPDADSRALEFALEQADLAETLGFDYCWVPERHFLEETSHSPAPEIVLGALAMRTRQIRLGASVVVSRFAHPALLAERAAVLDHLSRGRIDWAVGRASSLAELGVLGGDAGEAWQETVRALPGLWSEACYGMADGRFAMPARTVLPKPYQKPHPALWSAASDAAAEREAGGLGLGALAVAASSFNEQARRVGDYRDACASCEPIAGFINDRFMIRDLLYCHEGDDAGRSAGAALFNLQCAREAQQVALAELTGGARDCGLPGLVIGEPKSIIDTLRAWEAMGVDGVIFSLGGEGAVAQADILSSLRLFGQEVLPVFTRHRARAAAE